MSRRAKTFAIIFCVAMFFVGIFADNLGLVGWWL